MEFSQEIIWLLKEKYGGIKTKEAELDIERIKQGEPVSYVIGFVDFLGAKIDLSQRTLIPRPETEFWVEKAIADVRSRASDTLDIECLDMFAGSGCIGVSVLKNVPEAKVDFVDSESNAIKQTKTNCELNNISTSRWQIIKSDMFENVTGKYDFIFANPPYIAENSNDVQHPVLDNEPHEALFGGKDGLCHIKAFLNQADKYFKKNGKIYMEFGYDQKEAIEDILGNKNFSNVSFCRDQFKKWRYLVLSQ